MKDRGRPIGEKGSESSRFSPSRSRSIFSILFSLDPVPAVAEDRIVNRDGRRVFARAIVRQRDGRYYASLTGPQGSGILTSMTLANALTIVPEDVPIVEPGDEVTVMLLE